jgi:hypothetical protein
MGHNPFDFEFRRRRALLRRMWQTCSRGRARRPAAVFIGRWPWERPSRRGGARRRPDRSRADERAAGETPPLLRGTPPAGFALASARPSRAVPLALPPARRRASSRDGALARPGSSRRQSGMRCRHPAVTPAPVPAGAMRRRRMRGAPCSGPHLATSDHDDPGCRVLIADSFESIIRGNIMILPLPSLYPSWKEMVTKIQKQVVNKMLHLPYLYLP